MSYRTHRAAIGSLELGDASGIGRRLRGARFASYQVAVANGLTIQTLPLGVGGFAITDVGSGKTVQSRS